MKEKRIFGLDLLRVLAVVCVLFVHFFLNTHYYAAPMSGISLRMQSVVRNFCMMCVPLFLVLTGYLNKKKTYNLSFFKSIGSILIIWLFYSIIEYFILNIVGKTINDINFKNFLVQLTSFKACHYSWYVNMYIGLYFMSPIINNGYESLLKRDRKILVGLMIFSCFLPTIFNQLFGSVFSLPGYWVGSTSFIGYYILGKFIADTKPKVSKKTLLLLLLLNQFFIYTYQFLAELNYESFLTMVNTILVFLLCYDLQIKNKFLKKIVAYFSKLSFDIYLASSLIDKLVYPWFSKTFSFDVIGQHRIFLYLPLIFLTVFSLSSLLGIVRKKLIPVR